MIFFFCLFISNACCHCYLGIVVIRFNQFSDLLTQGDIGTFSLLVWLGQKCICYRYDDCLQMILCWKWGRKIIQKRTGIIQTRIWPESLDLTRNSQEAKESECIPPRLPHEDQLHVCQDEAVSNQRALCPDNLPVGEGRNRSWPWHSFFLCRTGTSQWAGAYRMGQQSHGAADQRQGKASRWH